MVGLGTLINVACIVAGGSIGLLASSLVTQRLQEALLRSCGVCVIFVGAAGTLQHMLVATVAANGSVSLSTQGTMMLLISLANLSLVGSTLIFCVGVSLIWPRTFKPANMLPAVVIAVILALV